MVQSVENFKNLVSVAMTKRQRSFGNGNWRHLRQLSGTYVMSLATICRSSAAWQGSPPGSEYWPAGLTGRQRRMTALAALQNWPSDVKKSSSFLWPLGGRLFPRHKGSSFKREPADSGWTPSWPIGDAKTRRSWWWVRRRAMRFQKQAECRPQTRPWTPLERELLHSRSDRLLHKLQIRREIDC